LPWSTCPIVPMLQCGFVRVNFSLAMCGSCASLARVWRLSVSGLAAAAWSGWRESNPHHQLGRLELYH
jgi:hypothetical protein